MPVAGFALGARRGGQIAGGQRPVALDLFEDCIEIGRSTAQLSQRVVLVHFIGLAPILEQRPAADRNDRGFVRPLLRILSPPISQVLEALPVVGTETRPKDEKLRRHQYVDVVELEQSERIDDTPKMPCIGLTGWSRPVEALCRQGDTPRFGG